MDSRIYHIKKLELKVDSTLKMSVEEQIRVLKGLQAVIDEMPEEEAFWLRIQRNRIYYNLPSEARRLVKERMKSEHKFGT